MVNLICKEHNEHFKLTHNWYLGWTGRYHEIIPVHLWFRSLWTKFRVDPSWTLHSNRVRSSSSLWPANTRRCWSGEMWHNRWMVLFTFLILSLLSSVNGNTIPSIIFTLTSIPTDETLRSCRELTSRWSSDKTKKVIKWLVRIFVSELQDRETAGSWPQIFLGQNKWSALRDSL